MKTLLVARKTLSELLREPQLLWLYLLFPALMIVLYYVAFGQPAQSMARWLNILVIDQDGGPHASRLIEHLRAAEFDGAPVFGVELPTARAAADIRLAERKAALLLTIPSGFSAAVEAGTPGAAPLRLTGDPTSDNYIFARSFLVGALEQYSDGLTGWVDPAPVRYEFVTNTGTLSDFQFGVPGVLVFGTLFGIIAAAMLVVRETVSGTLQRLRLSRMRPADLILGVTLAMMILAAVQMPVSFGAALLFGFSSPGSLPLAMLTGVLLSLAATGLGLVAACFTKNDGEAANLGTVFMMPLAFLSGAMFPMPDLTLFRLGGQTVGLADLLPSTHAADAMRRVLVYGDGLSQVLPSLAALLALSALILALGVALFGRLKLKA